jgi:hypothetical protein
VRILNRRNAVLGWIAWQVGKRVAKRKAMQAVPIETTSKRRGRVAIATGLAAAAGALLFWRSRRKEDDTQPVESEPVETEPVENQPVDSESVG